MNYNIKTYKGVKNKNTLLFVVSLLLFTVPSLAQEVRTAVDTTTIKIGEELKLTLSVEVNSTDLVVFPEEKTMGLLEVIQSYKTDTLKSKQKVILNKEYGLTQFDSGHFVVPPQKISVNGKTFSSDSVLVEVRDVVVDTTKQKLYDIKPIIQVEKPSEGMPHWLLYVLVGLIVIAAVIYFFFIKKKKQMRATVTNLPPFEEAIQHLAALDEENLLEKEEYKKYYSELTEVLKRYLDEKVYDNALESTSDELIEQLELLKDSGKLPISKEIIQGLRKVLQTSDLVKFAKSQPDKGTAKVDRNIIEKVLHETKQAIPEPTEEELLLNEQYRVAQERKKKKKKLIVTGITVFGLVLLTVIGLGIKYGFSTVRDEVFGHPTKTLLEGKWIRSEYGTPAIVITTPEVLKRVSSKELEATNTESFAYGSLTSNFGLVVNTTQIPKAAMSSVTNNEETDEPEEVDLEQVNEMSLQMLEQQGATDLVVKQEDFESGKGLTGMKAYGTLNIKNPVTNSMQVVAYEILSFQQENALQQVMIFHQEKDVYAEQIVSKVLESVELKKNDE